MVYQHSYIAGLVNKVKQGDSQAFAELYTMTCQKVFSYAGKYLRDDYLAEDAVQEIYVLAYKNLDKLKDPYLFIAWLNQISFRVCYDIDKKRKGEATDYDTEILEEVIGSDFKDNPEELTFIKDQSRRLSEAVQSLDTSDQQLIELRYIYNKKIDEIVFITGLSKSTVKRHLNNALEQLKKIMSGQE
ncbi:MAG: sigma-70 family RNA polymerase sigma factor [Lachnospiraceae bacterium]|nr:sigma-70 family RNA polymerase sigma factor [Lachnospiraceae bacterium]